MRCTVTMHTPPRHQWGKNLDRCGLALLLLGLILAPVAGRDQYTLNVLVMMALNASLATGLAIVVRVGRLSLAQATFSGIGGYTSGLLVMKLGVAYWLALPVAGVFAACVGLLIGLSSLRLRGFYFAIATFVFSQIVIIILRAWTPVTGGMSGMFGLPVPSDVLGISFRSALNYYYLALLLTGIALWVHHLSTAGSRFGRGLSVLGEDETLARTLGVPATRYRLYAFAISSFIAGIAGSLSAHFIQGISPADIQPIASIFIVVMVMVGGTKSLSGPIIGAVLLTIIPEMLRASAQWSMVFYGIFLLACVFFFQKGLAPLLRNFTHHLLKIAPQQHKITEHYPQPSYQPAVQHSSPERELFEFRHMCCQYGNLTVLEDVNWQIEPGVINGLIGPNGAGKTTFFNVMTGLAPLSRGQLLWKGQSLKPRPEMMARMGLGRTFQHVRLLSHHTVYETLILGGELPTGQVDDAHIFWLMDKLKLMVVRDMPCAHLSHYHKRLVTIGVAYASNPRLILLDEPFAGLDDTETAELSDMIANLQQETGTTMLLIEHKLSVIMRICANLTVLDHGKIIAQGSPEQVARHGEVIKAYLGDG